MLTAAETPAASEKLLETPPVTKLRRRDVNNSLGFGIGTNRTANIDGRRREFRHVRFRHKCCRRWRLQAQQKLQRFPKLLTAMLAAMTSVSMSETSRDRSERSPGPSKLVPAESRTSVKFSVVTVALSTYRDGG